MGRSGCARPDLAEAFSVRRLLDQRSYRAPRHGLYHSRPGVSTGREGLACGDESKSPVKGAPPPPPPPYTRGAVQGAGQTLSSAAIDPIGSASPASKPALSSSTALPPAPAMSSAPAPLAATGASAVLPAPGRREARVGD